MDGILKRTGPTHWNGTFAGYTVHVARLSPGWYVWIMPGVPPRFTEVVLLGESPAEGAAKARAWIEKDEVAAGRVGQTPTPLSGSVPPGAVK